MKGKRVERRICMIDDSGEYAALSAVPVVTCGKCGAKARDASLVCEPGIHSDVT